MTDDSTREDGPPSPREAFAGMVADEWQEKYERPRGVLTDTDRRFLWGIQEYAHENTAINRRKDIRERVENGIRDLFYLTMISKRDRERIFEKLEEHGEGGELRAAIASLVHFMYLGLDGDEEWFEETLSHGIGNAENELRPDDTTYYTGASVEAGVDVEIDIKRGYDVDEIEERFRSGHGNTLTPTEVGVLVREGRLSPKDVEDLEYTMDSANPVFAQPEPKTPENDLEGDGG